MVVNVAVVAAASRSFVLTLQVLFNALIPDHNADAFIAPGKQDVTTLDSVVTFLLGGLKRWDAQYFLHISEHGYTYENTLAFFPLYPTIVYHLGSVLNLFFGSVASFHTSLLISGVCLNFHLFVIATILLYKLSRIVLANEKEALVTAILFCINPASIFFSACYSETLFSTLTFGGLLLMEKNWMLLSSILLGLSGSVRSNGLINGGFLIYVYLKDILKLCSVNERFYNTVQQILRSSFAFGVGFCLFLIPFTMFQVYGSLLFCDPSRPISEDLLPEIYILANEKNYRMFSEQPPEWCYQWLPFSYSYVQSTYWNVGFLRYFEFRQIPNFILAMPLLVLCGNCCFRYFKRLFEKLQFSPSALMTITKDRMLVYFIHGSALLIFCTFFIHVQVTTRLFASSSPLLYWISSSVISRNWTTISENLKPANEDTFLSYFFHRFKMLLRNSLHSKFIIIYFSLFSIVGTLLHSNFLPWT